MCAKRVFIYIAVIFLMTLNGLALNAGDNPLEKWVVYSTSREAGGILSWARNLAMKELGEQDHKPYKKKSFLFPDSYPPFYGKLGLFVTIISEKKVRGCFGAFHHSSDNLKFILTSYLRGALRYDDRYTPLAIEELDDADIIITVASQPHYVNDIYSVDISSHGIILNLENGGNMVFVPSEIKTHDYLQRVIGRRRVSGISAFKAVTIKTTRGDFQ